MMRTLALGCILVMAVTSCTKERSFEGLPNRLRLVFLPTANEEGLVFGKQYISPAGEDYTMTAMKLYVGNVRLLDSAMNPVSPVDDRIFLLDAAQPGTLGIDLQGDGRPFMYVSLQTGVDSTRNVSGAQTGALDPANGMFWTWNTGYIFFKLEGTSSLSPAAGNRFTYHIGGFRTGESARRTVVMPIPNGQPWSFSGPGRSEARIKVDVDKWFRSKHDLPVSANNEVMSPGAAALLYADNGAEMFQLTEMVRR